MIKSSKNKKNLLYLSLFVLFFALIAIWGQIKKEHLKKGPSAYTVAIITNFEYGSRVAPWFDYEFKVKDKVYKGTYDIVDKMGKYTGNKLRSYIGKQFFVKYYIPNPNDNILLIYKPISCNTKEIPPNGWKKIPKVGKLPYCEE